MRDATFTINAKEFVLARIVCRVADIFIACWWSSTILRRRWLTVLRVFTVVVVLLCFSCMNNTEGYGMDQKIRAS